MISHTGMAGIGMAGPLAGQPVGLGRFQGAAPPGAQRPQGPTSGAEQRPVAFLSQAADALTQYEQAEQDPADRAEGSRILGEIRQLLNKDRLD